jgi:hypothetical protein
MRDEPDKRRRSPLHQLVLSGVVVLLCLPLGLLGAVPPGAPGDAVPSVVEDLGAGGGEAVAPHHARVLHRWRRAASRLGRSGPPAARAPGRPGGRAADDREPPAAGTVARATPRGPPRP